MAKYCAICNEKIGLLGGSRVTCLEGSVCGKCFSKRLRRNWSQSDYALMENLHIGEVLDLFEERNNEDKKRLKGFECTYRIYRPLQFDDNNKLLLFEKDGDYAITRPWRVIDELAPLDIEKCIVLKYSQIVSYDVIENGKSISSGGVGRAAVGALVAGGVGAVVGASTRGFNEQCEKLFIKLTVSDYSEPSIFIPFVDYPMKKNNPKYLEIEKNVEKTVSKLQLILESNPNPDESKTNQSKTIQQQEKDPIDDIRRYKELLDEGIISQEEFETKKKQLLF